jgi:glucose-1-phosphate thymidylyltransferase
MQILVTGAHGFVGQALCGALTRRGFSVIAAMRSQKSIADCKTITVGEIHANTLWKDALKEVDVVVHLAARVHVMNENTQDPLAEFDGKNKVVSLEEKPSQPKSNYAVTGLYFYDQDVVKMAKSLKPSKRNELEITDLNRLYLDQNQLHVEVMGRGYAWLDRGTHESLLEASQFIATLENRQGLKVACPEEIAYRQNWINAHELEALAAPLLKNGYGQYLKRILQEKII